jgi:hypothetical protein
METFRLQPHKSGNLPKIITLGYSMLFMPIAKSIGSNTVRGESAVDNFRIRSDPNPIFLRIWERVFLISMRIWII